MARKYTPTLKGLPNEVSGGNPRHSLGNPVGVVNRRSFAGGRVTTLTLPK
jgi:hypothetical protein